MVHSLALADTGAPTLSELSLAVNHVGDAGVEALVGALHTCPTVPPLRVLCLGNSFGGNVLGDAAAVAIAHAIASYKLTHLVHLNFSYNLISDDGSHALADAIRGAPLEQPPSSTAMKATTNLEQLAITGNRLSQIGLSELDALARACKFCLLARPQHVGSAFGERM